ncbi:MAG: hypothetical protein L0154_27650 [Chloroflexi bacterium]|nr:hypothetical protein [Chloroflexota bacterium]
MQQFMTMLTLLVLYGAIHSFMAAVFLKRWVRDWMGERVYQGLYRLLFNIAATLTLIPVLYYGVREPGAVVWRADGAIAVIFILIQLVGLIGLSVSLLQIDGMRFLGVRQLVAWLNGDPLPLPDEPMQTGGVYGLVRHPLYLFSLMAIWPSPIMTTTWLGFNVGATLYFIIGSLFEEQKLREDFGEQYADYQNKVPWMIPFVRL